LPDFIIVINNYKILVTNKLEKDFVFKKGLWSPRITGSHNQQGILIIYGDFVKKGIKLNKISVFDIAPTILHVFGLPIPRYMSGQAIRDAFEQNSYIYKNEPIYVDKYFYIRSNIIKRLKRRNRGLRKCKI